MNDGGDNNRQAVFVPPPPLRWWRTTGGKWALVSAAAIVLIAAGLLIFWPKDSEVEELPATENASCDADSCDSTPIRFVDLELGSGEIVATLVDPYGAEVQRVDPPFATGDSTAEWTWDAALEDPIGDYTVQFTSDSTETIEHTFTVDPVTGPFGVVQMAADAIIAQDWDRVASLDKRIADELEANGEAFLEEQYPATLEKHWVPYDQSGETNANGTTIIGAYITYSEEQQATTGYCELWSVSANNTTMRSDQLPMEGVQAFLSLTGREAPSNFREWVDERCVLAAEPDTD